MAAARERARAEASFRDKCLLLEGSSVRLLDERNPSGDWKRWSAAITERCRAAGEDFVLALEHLEEMDEPPAVPDVNSEDAYVLTRPQRRQAAIRALIMNSLPPNDDPGTPRRLCRGLQHVGGYIDGDEQVWLVLRKRYEVTEADTEPADLLRDLLMMEWPAKVSEADYQTMVAKKVRLAVELDLAPDGVDAAESRKLAMWWDVIASPPPNSPYHSAAEKARIMTGGERGTLGDREYFVDVMCTEIRRIVEERRKTARARALFSGVGGCEGCQHGACELGHEVQDVFATQPSSAQTDRRTTMRTPGGGWQRHPCVRC